MEQVLYRKYRPKSFKDAIGQEHVTKTLEQAIKSGRVSHAYLFTGPKGVGKTSVARILAHEVNQLPYNQGSVHLDIIEIDAASNRRIDEIRDLRDKVRIAPAMAKYKIYIIDEVHMLTKEAFNALLKTLEEPPAHCIFILATTEAHKLPETIVSRTQRFEFKAVPVSRVTEHLQSIAKKEKIDIDLEALTLLAEFGNGSFRDSIGYLDQLSTADKQITEEEVRQVLGLPSMREIEAIMQALDSNNAKQIIQAVQAAKEQGVGAPELASMISKQLRQSLIDGHGNAKQTNLLKALIDVDSANNPYEYLEILLLEATITEHGSIPANASPNEIIEDKPAETVNQKTQQPEKQEAIKSSVARQFDLELWPELVGKSKTRNASLYTALRLAKPSYQNGILTLSFQFPLHKKKVEQADNKALVAELAHELSNTDLVIECAVDKTSAKPPMQQISKTDESPAHINSISNIFGAAEVLET